VAGTAHAAYSNQIAQIYSSEGLQFFHRRICQLSFSSGGFRPRIPEALYGDIAQIIRLANAVELFEQFCWYISIGQAPVLVCCAKGKLPKITIVIREAIQRC
jgi:hypothetical protein